jgi:hypothetical protein
MPAHPGGTHGYYNASPECWSVYTEVLASEYSNAVIFGQVHQPTVDTYAVQHAGGAHPDKSVDIHLYGLHLYYERGIKSAEIPPMLQELAGRRDWPHFEPPEERVAMTVLEVALAGSPIQHIEKVRDWSAAVWRSWGAHHAAIAALAG